MLLHKIKCMCNEKGVTLTQLEKELGISPKGIYKISPNSNAITLLGIAKILGTTVEELLEGEDVQGD